MKKVGQKNNLFNKNSTAINFYKPKENKYNNIPESNDNKIFVKKNKNIKNQDLSYINFFFILTSGQKYQVSANLNDSFKSVLDNFISDQCPSDYKNKIVSALFEGAKIDNNKSLLQNNIIEGTKVILVVKDSQNRDQNMYNDFINGVSSKPLSDSMSTQASTLTLDKEDKELLKNIYTLVQRLVNQVENKNDNIYSKKNSCHENNSECKHIHSNKHNHGLVLSYTNRNWKCDICKISYSNDESTYYCSLCDFDVCNCCIGIIKKYPLKQFYHEQTKLKMFKLPLHEHNLIYCRTSRYYNNSSGWICNICRKEYSNIIWSFYCTYCDFDICLRCAKKFINSDLLIYNIGIKIDKHKHRLVYMITNRNWICNICRNKYSNFIPTYYCTKCDYDVCRKCMKIISDEKKYPLIDEGNRENNTIKIVEKDCHRHPLIYCITSRNAKARTTWICNECKGNYDEDEWSFYCSLCDYDICYDCYLNFDNNY